MDNTEYYDKLLLFIEYPWQEDYEILIVDHIEKELAKFIENPQNYSNQSVKRFLRQVYDSMSPVANVSDKFINNLLQLT